MTAARVVFVAISSVTGTCFAALAGLSISAMAVPVRRFHGFSIVIAAVAICFAYLAFRAALAGHIDEDTFVAALRRGVLGALVGTVVIVALILLFRSDIEGFLGHALGKRASSITTASLVTTSVLLGFGSGFVVRSPKAVD